MKYDLFCFGMLAGAARQECVPTRRVGTRGRMIYRKTLLLVILLGVSPLTTVQATCRDLALRVPAAIQAGDLAQLQGLLTPLRNSGCPVGYLAAVERSTAQLAAKQAAPWVARKQPQQARQLLNQVPIETWETQELRGELAAAAQQWNHAARYYNRALDILDDPGLTPLDETISEDTVRRIMNRAAEAQLLANHLQHTISRSGAASGVLRGKTRNFQAESIPVPVQFDTNEASLLAAGRAAATRLAVYLQDQQFAAITLTGHADERGTKAINQLLSMRRVATLKAFLYRAGVRSAIETVAYGEDRPMRIDNPDRYTQKQIWAMNRRVELQWQ